MCSLESNSVTVSPLKTKGTIPVTRSRQRRKVSRPLSAQFQVTPGCVGNAGGLADLSWKNWAFPLVVQLCTPWLIPAILLKLTL